MGIIIGNPVGGSGSAVGNTFILTDENEKNQLIGTVVESETMFNARPKDIRIGKIAVTDSGIVEGENTIIYRTEQSVCAILPGEFYSIPLPRYDQYDYTKLQCIICPFDTDMDNSVAVEKVVLYDSVYQVGSTEVLATVSKNYTTKSIELNIKNDTDTPRLIYYFTYREEEI